MAANFKITTRYHKNELHMRLKGDFDGSSAYELVRVLKAHWNKSSRIVIHTDHLKTIYRFGLHIWRNHISSLGSGQKQIWITGDYASDLAQSPG